MSRCVVCGIPIDEHGSLCGGCADVWLNSVARRTRARTGNPGNYDRQYHDWLETKRRERVNGGAA